MIEDDETRPWPFDHWAPLMPLTEDDQRALRRMVDRFRRQQAVTRVTGGADVPNQLIRVEKDDDGTYRWD